MYRNVGKIFKKNFKKLNIIFNHYSVIRRRAAVSIVRLHYIIILYMLPRQQYTNIKTCTDDFNAALLYR